MVNVEGVYSNGPRHSTLFEKVGMSRLRSIYLESSHFSCKYAAFSSHLAGGNLVFAR